MHLADILPRLEIIAVQIAAVHPVRHPDHVVVPVHGQTAHLDLPRFGVPVDRTLPFQVVRIVNGDLNVLALAVFESLATGIQLAVPHVDIETFEDGNPSNGCSFSATSRPCLSYL